MHTDAHTLCWAHFKKVSMAAKYSCLLLLTWIIKSQWNTTTRIHTIKTQHITSHIIKLWNYEVVSTESSVKYRTRIQTGKISAKNMLWQWKCGALVLSVFWEQWCWDFASICVAHSIGQMVVEKVHKVHVQLWRKIKLCLFRVSNM